MNYDEAFNALYDVVVKLRGPDGCPWDREQTPASLRDDLIEECYECVEAIDEKNPAHIAEELGDLFLLVTMLSYIHEQEGAFTAGDVLDGVTKKLIRRHPHVFGGVKVKDSAEVLVNWDRIKTEQEGRKGGGILDGVSRGLPPLDRAFKLQKKAAKAGFDWPDLEGVISKIREELEEVREAAGCLANNAGTNAVAAAANTPANAAAVEKIEDELGDLIFSAVNLCRYLNIDPSLALHRTNNKFTGRFGYVEKKMKEAGQNMEKGNLDMMDKYWNEAKENT